MPDEIRYKIVARTIPQFKVGEDFELLKNALPGFLDHIDNGSGNLSETMENFGFVLQVHCSKIIRLEYGKDNNDYDGTIYGKVQEKPCLQQDLTKRQGFILRRHIRVSRKFYAPLQVQ